MQHSEVLRQLLPGKQKTCTEGTVNTEISINLIYVHIFNTQKSLTENLILVKSFILFPAQAKVDKYSNRHGLQS